MPSITLDYSRNTIKESSGTITITPSNFSLPSDTLDKRYSNMQYQYSTNNSNWQTGNIVTINKSTSLNKFVTCYCRIVYTISYYNWVPPITDEQGNVIEEGYWEYSRSGTGTSESVSKSTTIYFHPGPFDFEATNISTSSKNIIANVLTADKINDEWIPHFQNVYHWYNQTNNNYNVDLTVQKNKPIKAEWFTKCLTAMREIGKNSIEYSETIEANKTIITAERINRLNFDGIN